MQLLMKQVLLCIALLRFSEGAKISSLEAAVRSAIQSSFATTPGASNVSERLSEEEIQYMLSLAREGGDGLSRIEVTRFRAKDSVTGEEYDDVFYNETSEDEGRSICQEEGDNFTPSLAVIETARRLRETEGGPLMASAISAFVDIAEYFGQEIYHMEAPVGSLDPIEVPSAEKLSQLSTDWLEELNAVLTKEQRDPCPTGPKWLLVCMKKTTCLLERAAEATPHIITPGRMATYLEVAKEVEDHYEEFAVQAFMGLPYMPDLCDGEESSLEFPGALPALAGPTALLQLKAESEATDEQGERYGRAVSAVLHTQRASARTVQALKDHSRLHLLEASFFTHTWKKACELIGCKTNSFVDIMDASAGHTAELVEVKASWHAVKTHHVAFMQFRTAVWSAMNASSAFHENFTGFIYHPGRARGSKRVNPIYKETGDVLSTALALQRGNPKENNNGKNIKKSGWWCFSFTATATGAYGKKFPTNEATFGVIIGFKLLSGSTTSLKTLLSSKEPTVDLKTSVGLTIGYVPQLASFVGVRAGVSVGGTLALGPKKVKMSVSLGLGMSAATGAVHPSLCGGPQKIGIFSCGGSVAASFTLFCKEINFLNGDNGAALDDPCATGSKVYVQNHRRRRRWHYDMPGQGRTVEEKAEYCRERCNKVKGCKHYSYWKDGGCHLQNWDSHTEKKNNAKTGPPTCCAVGRTRWEYPQGHRRRRILDMSGQGRSSENTLEDCRKRCARVNGCKHWTYWTDGGCHLSDNGAEVKPDSSRRRPTVSGVPVCEED